MTTEKINAYLEKDKKKSGKLYEGYELAKDPAKWITEKEAENLKQIDAEANAEEDQLDGDDEGAKKKSKKSKKVVEPKGSKKKAKDKDDEDTGTKKKRVARKRGADKMSEDEKPAKKKQKKDKEEEEDNGTSLDPLDSLEGIYAYVTQSLPTTQKPLKSRNGGINCRERSSETM